MWAFVSGVQGQSLPIQAAEDFEEAVNMFVPQPMRFAGKRSSVVFNTFMANATNLDFETPLLFGPSRNPDRYTSRLALEHEIHPEYQERLKKLNDLAIATYRSWVAFFDLYCAAGVVGSWDFWYLFPHRLSRKARLVGETRMVSIEFTEEEKQALDRERFEYPDNCCKHLAFQ